MTKKRILFVGEDFELWEQLRLMGDEETFPWDLAFAKNGLQALASIAQSSSSAVPAILGSCMSVTTASHGD